MVLKVDSNHVSELIYSGDMIGADTHNYFENIWIVFFCLYNNIISYKQRLQCIMRYDI